MPFPSGNTGRACSATRIYSTFTGWNCPPPGKSWKPPPGSSGKTASCPWPFPSAISRTTSRNFACYAAAERKPTASAPRPSKRCPAVGRRAWLCCGKCSRKAFSRRIRRSSPRPKPVNYSFRKKPPCRSTAAGLPTVCRRTAWIPRSFCPFRPGTGTAAPSSGAFPWAFI